jgi:AraC family transcriptional activator of tynA and feaB
MRLIVPAGTTGNVVGSAGSPDDSTIHLTTDNIGPRERAEFWRETVCRNFVDVELTTKLAPDFSAELTSRKMGDLRISAVNASPHAVRSKLRDTSGSRENCIYAIAMLEGGGLFEQDGREAFLFPGDLTFYDATRWHQLAFNQHTQMLLIHLSRSRLRECVPGLEQCTTRRVNGGSGVGAVVSTYIRTLSSRIEETSLSNRIELAECTFDLLAAALSSVRPDGALPSRSRSLSLYRVKEFIEQHLADPTLNADAISLGVALSPRYINKLFEDEDSSSSLLRYVWARRLEHCRRDLSDPARLGHRVSDIALRWGFNDLSHFSRSFKARFNLSPREFRDQALRGAKLSG